MKQIPRRRDSGALFFGTVAFSELFDLVTALSTGFYGWARVVVAATYGDFFPVGSSEGVRSKEYIYLGRLQ